MKRYLIGVMVLLGLVVGAYFTMHALQQKQPRTSVSDPQAKTVTIPVEGMSCISCAVRVKKALNSVDGVTEVEVSLLDREARVRYLDTKVSPERLVAAINDAGYRTGTPEAEETR